MSVCDRLCLLPITNSRVRHSACCVWCRAGGWNTASGIDESLQFSFETRDDFGVFVVEVLGFTRVGLQVIELAGSIGCGFGERVASECAAIVWVST